MTCRLGDGSNRKTKKEKDERGTCSAEVYTSESGRRRTCRPAPHHIVALQTGPGPDALWVILTPRLDREPRVG